MYQPTLDAILVGNVIADFRKRKGVSQEPTLETLYRIAVALDVKMSDIVAEIENRIE